MSITFIGDSLIKFDKNTEEFEEKLKNVKYIKHITNDSEIESDKIIFYDKNDNIVNEASYEMVGTYYVKSNLWIWPWSNAMFSKKITMRSRKMLLYGLSLSGERDYNLKTEIINSRFTITDKIQIDIHLAISSEITKTPYILKIYVPLKEEDDEDFYPFLRDKDIDEENIYKITYLFIYDLKF